MRKQVCYLKMICKDPIVEWMSDGKIMQDNYNPWTMTVDEYDNERMRRDIVRQYGEPVYNMEDIARMAGVV